MPIAVIPLASHDIPHGGASTGSLSGLIRSDRLDTYVLVAIGGLMPRALPARQGAEREFLVPVRAFARILNSSGPFSDNVRWHGSWTGLELLGHKVVLEPRKHTATVKGHRVRLGEPPRVEGNAMLVPFASLVKSLGKHVEWHKEGKYALASIR